MGKTRFMPLNKYVLLEGAEKKEESQSPVLVPEDYKVVRDFGMYRIVESSSRCENYFTAGQLVVVEENMLREVDLGENKKYYVIPENLIVLRSEEPKTSGAQLPPYNENAD
ncbi:hypothetical protein CL629_02530 [bacterium]|nr:hypothetical protein [bacterium]